MDNTNIIWPGWTTDKKIGSSGFGEVYEIRRELLGETETAALKVISLPENDSEIEELRSEGYDDGSLKARYFKLRDDIVQEYKLMRQLNGHTHVVNCDDVQFTPHEDGIGWNIMMKMELLTPLTKLDLEHMTEAQIVKIGADISDALELCSRYSIVHRDIKPQNIFVSDDGEYKLGDFGIARTMERTASATKVGTFKFMAPEVYNNKPYGAAADIYSLGLVLYWLLNGLRIPFLPDGRVSSSQEQEAYRRRFKGDTMPAPANGSAELQRIVMKACAYDPSARYQSAKEMHEQLEALCTGTKSAAPKKKTAAAVRPAQPVNDAPAESEGSYSSTYDGAYARGSSYGGGAYSGESDKTSGATNWSDGDVTCAYTTRSDKRSSREDDDKTVCGDAVRHEVQKKVKAKSFDQKRKSKLLIAAAALAAIIIAMSVIVIVKDDAPAEQTNLTEREAWLAIRDKVMDGIATDGIDYLDFDMQKLRSYYNGINGLYFLDGSGEYSSAPVFEEDYVNDDGDDYKVLTIGMDKNDADTGVSTTWVQFAASPENQRKSSLLQAYYFYSPLKSTEKSAYSNIIPAGLIDLVGKNQTQVRESLGITDRLYEYITEESTQIYEYEATYDRVGNLLVDYYTTDGTETVAFKAVEKTRSGDNVIETIGISFLTDGSNAVSLWKAYTVEQYPQPDSAAGYAIPAELNLNDSDLEMIKRWCAARDRFMSMLNAYKFDFLTCDNIDKLGQYYDSIDGIYFCMSEDDGEVSDSYSLMSTYANDGAAIMNVKAKVGTDSYADVCSVFYNNSKNLRDDSGYQYKLLSLEYMDEAPINIYNVRTYVYPEALTYIIRQTRYPALRYLYISDSMVQWLYDKQEELGDTYSMFGRSFVTPNGGSADNPQLVFSKYLANADGNTVHVMAFIEFNEAGYCVPWVQFYYY